MNFRLADRLLMTAFVNTTCEDQAILHRLSAVFAVTQINEHKFFVPDTRQVLRVSRPRKHLTDAYCTAVTQTKYVDIKLTTGAISTPSPTKQRLGDELKFIFNPDG